MKPSSVFLLAPLALMGSVQALAVPAPAPVPSAPVLKPRLDINSILAYISELFPIDEALDVAAVLIEAADEILGDLLGYSTTYNDLEDGDCGDLLLIFARGTDEPGNVGALVGPEFIAALGDAVGSSSYTVTAQGVNDYDASVTNYLEGGDSSGSSDMASLVTEAFTNCPNTKVVLSGYSQGAQIVHKAASELDASTMEKVSAVVTFGDPDSTSAVANIDSSKVLVICHDGDAICQFGDIITLAHLTYAENVTAAASFVVSAAGL